MPPKTEQLLAEIKAWCVANHVKQAELARMLGVQRSAVTDWYAYHSKNLCQPIMNLTSQPISLCYNRRLPGTCQGRLHLLGRYGGLSLRLRSVQDPDGSNLAPEIEVCGISFSDIEHNCLKSLL